MSLEWVELQICSTNIDPTPVCSLVRHRSCLRFARSRPSSALIFASNVRVALPHYLLPGNVHVLLAVKVKSGAIWTLWATPMGDTAVWLPVSTCHGHTTCRHVLASHGCWLQSFTSRLRGVAAVHASERAQLFFETAMKPCRSALAVCVRYFRLSVFIAGYFRWSVSARSLSCQKIGARSAEYSCHRHGKGSSIH